MATSEQLALGFGSESGAAQIEADNLPDGWRLCRLGAVCQINPSRKGQTNYADDLPVTFVPMAAVDEVTGTIARPEVRPFGSVKKGYTWFVENDVLFAKITPCMENGKAAIARDLSNGVGFGSTEFHVLRPGPDVLPAWIHFFVRQPSFRAAAAQHFTGSVGQQRVPESFLTAQLLPIPPLSEQRCIVARIEELAARIEKARGLRRQAIEEAEVVLPAALAEVRDSVTSAYRGVPLGQLVDVKGGGTPSTQNPAFWGGDIPWITPKDMKQWELNDSEDHITDAALSQPTAKWIGPGAVLVVTRGMILARTLPVALARSRITVNQDMKALCPRTNLLCDQPLTSEYLAYMLRAVSADILARVEIAGHGTRRLPTDVLTSYAIPVPPLSEQRRIIAYLDSVQAKANAVSQMQAESAAELAALLPAVLERAFKGGL